MRKLKLLFTGLALLVGGVFSANAQTDVTSTYLTNADFESGTAATADVSTYIAPSSWTLVNGGNGASSTAAYGSSKKVNKVTPPSSAASEFGSNCYVIQGAWSANNYIYQTRTLPAGNYKLVYYVQRLNSATNINANNTGIYKKSTSSYVVKGEANDLKNASTSSFTERTLDFSLTENTEVEIRVGYKAENVGSNATSTAALAFDNIKLIYTDFKAGLRAVIAQAQAINARISTLGDDITTAQTTLNDASASKDAIDGAVTTLRSAISTQLAAYPGLNAAGDDITSFIVNNGFETSATFDGTSLGSGSDPKSNATPTSGSTLLYNAKNVYQINGWELLTTETSDFARTFSMPYDKTLYVVSNNSVAGQAVASPTNGSSVTTSNDNLLFVEANWCENAVLGVKQTIPLPAGSYRLTFDSYVTNWIGNADSRCGVSYSETSNYKWPTELNAWVANEVDFTLDAQTDVTISMGYKKNGNVGGGNSAFLFVDNVKLTYFDPQKLAQIQWQEVWNALKALDKTALPDAAETAITDALAETEPTTIDGYNTAKAALQALIDSYDGIKTAYDKALALIDFATDEKDNSTGDSDKTTFATAITTASTNIETRTAADDLTNDYNTLETARQTYITGGAQPTAGHVFDYTFKLTNPSFENGTNGWSLERNTTGQWNYGRSQNSPIDGEYNLDAWAPQINYINVSQTKTLPAGVYEISAYVYSNPAYNQHVYANNGTDYPSTNLSEANTWQQLTASFINYNEVNTKIGLYSQGKNENGNSDGWFRLDNFKLSYKGNLLDNETANALKATVVTGKMNSTVAATQASALDAFENAQTIDNYNALKTAITNAAASKEVYIAIDAALNKVEGWTTNKTSVTDPMRLKYNNGTYSDETTADDIYAEYQAAEIDALTSASATDWTSAIINASFETGDMTGWDAASRSDTGVKDQSNGTYSITSGDAVDGLKLFNSWGGTAENNVYQTIKNLPAGTYTLTAVLAGFKDESLVLAANSETNTTVVADNKTVGHLTSVTFTLADATDVVIKASNTKSAGTSDASFIKADNFHLYVGESVPASAYKPNLLYAINNATNARKAANEGTGVFQIPASAGATLASEISEAQDVYDNASATKEQIDQAIIGVDAARTTYEDTELNVPADGKRYKLTLTDRGTLTYQTATTDGNYGFPFMTAGDYMAQSFILTQVSGNNYTISFEDLDGNTRYICTRAQYGEGGTGTAGIRSFVENGDGKEALQVKIQASSTGNVFYMLNTERDNAKLGSNGGDFYTDNAYTSWSIAEASQVTVSGSIAAEGGLATRIFPFTPSLPEGIKAYSCEDVNEVNGNDCLTLTKVDSPQANKPYLLYNDTENEININQTGWGTAKADSYNEGLFTGVYTSTPAPVGSYVLQNQEGAIAFYLVEDGAQPTVGAYRCYMNATAGARALYLNFNETTGVSDVKSKMEDARGNFYDLQGRRVAKPSKGLYIVNGKKVIIK